MKHEVIINPEVCVGCGLCVRDCVAGNLSRVGGKAAVTGSRCIACGHCEAICPMNAVTLTGFEDVPEECDTEPMDPDTLMTALRTRRSIRVFHDRPIPEEAVDRIIEAGRMAATGSNSQDTKYYVLEKCIAEAEAMAVRFFRSLPAYADRIDDAFFFKKAPLAIVLTGSPVNASLAAENMELMAEALGLGVLYSGYFSGAVNGSDELKALLGMEEGEKSIITLVLGYPGVRYLRTVRREPARVRKL